MTAHFGAVVYAKDVARVAAFYETVAGLQVTHAEATYAYLDAPGFRLVVHGIPAHIAQNIAIASPPQRREDTPIKLVFGVGSLAASRKSAAALGGLLNDAADEWQLDGLRVCDGHDPEGNVFQLRAPAA